MGCTLKDKQVRANRKARPIKPEPDTATVDTNDNLERLASSVSGIKPSPNPDLNNVSSSCDDGGWGYCTEEQLEELLLKNLELVCNEAVKKLVSLGYDEEVALKAVLDNGHCYNGMDILTNIVQNSLVHLNRGGGRGSNGEDPESRPVFENLRQLQEFLLTGSVCLLRQVRPHLTKGDAMWCLLMSDLQVGRASLMEIPVLPSPAGNGSSDGNGCTSASDCASGSLEGDSSSGASHGVAPMLGDGETLEFPMEGANVFPSHASETALTRDMVLPKRFNLSDSMKSLLKRNVAMFAAGFRANSKQFQNQSPAPPDALYGSSEVPVGPSETSQYPKNQDIINSMMSKFQDLNLDENTEQPSSDQRDEMILGLVHEIKDLEKQVKERKEWAQQKAVQAAKKLSNDLTELKLLRMEREETQRLKKGKQTHEEATMKRLNEMESALRLASAQVDRANAAVRKLENENAIIRAEMEASKLSASESVNMCLEVAKREKKYLKRLLVWEKQKMKMQEDIAAEKKMILDLERELAQAEAATKKAEAKWREEQKAKEVVLAQLEEERRLKEDAEVHNKRKLEALRQKIEIDFQRVKDDLQRLEQEYARLKESAQSTDTELQSDDFWMADLNGLTPQGETIARLLHELDQLEDSSDKEVSYDRECVLCMKDEVSIVFLPCAHQVICANCNENYGKKGKATCPCCRVPIEQRIRVYGASS